jgi:hypothetical protein
MCDALSHDIVAATTNLVPHIRTVRDELERSVFFPWGKRRC